MVHQVVDPWEMCVRLFHVGGWQQQITFQHHIQNLQKFYRMLQNNGFHKDHIKTFFASSGHLPGRRSTADCEQTAWMMCGDGPVCSLQPPGDLEGVYSATEKVVIRNHVSYVCRKQHCADTLVLYLNSPTRNDGTMLLWDANLNGIVRHTHKHKPDKYT